jgi:GntR family transcriptional regulator
MRAQEQLKTSPIQAIADELAAEIAAGQFSVGDRFSSELELRDRFGVGRHTIRESLKLLTEQGLLGRRRRAGTFVLATSPVSTYVHSLRNVRGLLDFASTTRLTVQNVSVIPSGSKLLADFEGLPQQKWLRLAGVRSVRGERAPLCWSEVLVPEVLSPPRKQLLSSANAVYEEVMAHTGFRLEYVEQEVSAISLPPKLLVLLGVKEGNAGLLVQRRYVAHTGVTFEISHNLYPAKRRSHDLLSSND